jgi:Flp pilus assembly pilin Flp
VFNLISKLMKDQSGQDLAEYGIALGVIAVGVGALVVALGGSVEAIWTSANTTISGLVP